MNTNPWKNAMSAGGNAPSASTGNTGNTHTGNTHTGTMSRKPAGRARRLAALLATLFVLAHAQPAAATAPTRPVITSTTADALSYTVEFRLGAYSQPLTKIEYSTDSGTTWAATEYVCAARCTIAVTETSAGDELTYGSTYPTKVKVHNADGSAESAVWSFQFITAPLPPAIGTVSAAVGSITVNFQAGGTGGAEISGIDYTTNDGTNWRSANCGTCSSATSVLITATSTGSSLTAGSSYTLRLRMRNRAGTSEPSAAVAVTVGAVPGTPVVNSVTGGADSLVVNATLGSSTGGAVTAVEYSTDNGTTWRTSGQATGTFTITGTSATGTPLTAGTSYTVRIRSVNGAGTSAGSNSKIATPTDAPMPPVLDSATGAANTIAVKTTTGMLLGGTLLRVEYSTDNGTTWQSTGGTNTSFTITSPSNDRNKTLTQGTRYKVAVRAVTNGGTSGTSNIIEAITGRAPGAPTIKSATRSDGAVTITVAAGTDHGSTPTRIEYSTDNGTTWLTTAIAAPGGTPTTGATPGTAAVRIVTESNGDDPIDDSRTYTLRVRLTNIVGTGAASKDLTVAPQANGGGTTTTPGTGNGTGTAPTGLQVGQSITVRAFANLAGTPLAPGAKFTAVSKTPKLCTVKKAKVQARAAGACRIWVKTTENGSATIKKLTLRTQTAG